MKKIRFAVIGTSVITKKFLEAASLCSQFEFAAVYSRNAEKGRAFVQNMGNIRVYDSLEDLASSGDIDAVYIASPTCCHASQSILMLENGKHVLCEKPVASNIHEWRNMQKVSAENKVIILEAMRPVFNPRYQTIKENLVKLGQIRKINFNYCQYSSRYDKFKNGITENAFRPELSNGALMDIGVYPVEVMAGLFGKPKHIAAHGYIIPGSIDGMGSITATYEGMQADLVYSKISDSHLPCEIQGEKGTMYFNSITGLEDIRIRYRNGYEEKYSVDTNQHDMIYEVEGFIDMIAGKRLAKEYNDISSISLEILDQARELIGIVFPADASC